MDRQEFESRAIAELDAVYRFARFLTRDAARADDLVQEVYARAFRPESIRSFRSDGSAIRAWLMTITRTICYSGLQRDLAARRLTARLAGSLHRHPEELEAPATGELASVDWSSMTPSLVGALDQLPAELRDVLWLWAVEGLKYREIATAIGAPIGTVMSRLHRARAQAARAILAARSGEDGPRVQTPRGRAAVVPGRPSP